MNDDEDIKRLFGSSSQAFDEHSKRIGTLLSKAQDKFEHDYTSYSAVAGTCLIVLAVVLAWLGKAESFSIVLSCIGGLVLVIALVLRHISADRQAKHTQTMLNLERERASFAQRSAILQHMWLYGPPKNLTTDQLRFMLGDNTPITSAPQSPTASDGTVTVIPPEK